MAGGKKTDRSKKNPAFMSGAEIVIGSMLFIAGGIIPLIVRNVVVPVAPELTEIFAEAAREDKFAYYKSLLLITSAVLILIAAAGEYVTSGKTVKWKNYFTPPVIAALAFAFFAVLSAVFSNYPNTALRGTIDRFEGLFALLSYIVLFITAMFYARKNLHINIILFGLVLSSFILGAIGLSQFAGFDFFRTPFGSYLVMGYRAELGAQFGNQAYGAQFNPNTFGLYASMLFPVLVSAGIYFACTVKRPVYKWALFAASLAAAALMLFCVAAAYSLGGFLGTAAAGAAATAIIAARFFIAKRGAAKQTKKKFPLAAGVLLGLFAAAAVAVFVLNPSANEAFKRLTDKLGAALDFGQTAVTDTFSFNGNEVTVTNQDRSFTVYYEIQSDNLFVLDSDRKPVDFSRAIQSEDLTRTVFAYSVPGYGNINITVFDGYFAYRNLHMAYVNGLLMPIAYDGVPVDPREQTPSFGFKGMESWASGRGYIWSRSLPLMLKNVFIGTGPDTFINAFPQRDPVGKLMYFNNPFIIVDKAHNLYIQTGVTTGGMSLLALLFLFAYFCFASFKSILQTGGAVVTVKPGLIPLRAGIFCGAVAYFVASMSTDSTVTSAPVFWIIIGLGFALNKFGDDS
ncbi:MAG: O-antigen ligase family protein [Defluviitaleaceae bacterium]|nr:O-antigen ligase family protein [Defluviitaleaceae bacterium]